MADSLAIALAQLDPVMGDIEGNLARIRAARAAAAAAGADLVIGSELDLCGYPPEDLVLKPAFQARCRAAAERLAAETADGGPAIILGSPWPDGEHLRNAALLLGDGRLLASRFKVEPDARRAFVPAPPQGPAAYRGIRLGLMVGEDMGRPEVTECLTETGADLLLLGNASPYGRGQLDRRIQRAVARVTESGLGLIAVNQVGGQDELVFDGASFALDADRSLRAQLPCFAPAVALTRWRRGGTGWRCLDGPLTPPLEGPESVYRALMLGLAGYVDKNRFPGVILGLSGGIGSALAAALAVDALGAARVRAVTMPAPGTSPASLEDAAAVAARLGIRLDRIPIAPAMAAFAGLLAPASAGGAADVAEASLRCRIRGVLLGALSGQRGDMVLSTGNKSELCLGHAAVPGDPAGFAVLKDVYRTEVMALAGWRNRHRPQTALGPEGPVMPERVLAMPAGAERRPGRADRDGLPPRDRLDAILEGLVEGERPLDDLVARGHDRATVERVARRLAAAESRRRQAPPGVTITARAFGCDRRYPITNRFVERGDGMPA